ncbi:3-oxoacyl-[acyl-carrier-protein] synthase I, chloroplastic [Capsicum annuum]|uniref:3-oxoacyl-[acyl-carrier-protein] synthase II, chloroplastic n=1 Tax=Capsicum annuum TaxID=4072 RepID=UPI001FB076B4|nr:3-oxoacyl-[acyl-carrier-protein] synthase II, chloroplastic [Capsicum annuum]KAF3654116.1 3-oxoacyl-[acyl-carrier-protein] synthase I, chloroplastic [Capsicum annuum]
MVASCLASPLCTWLVAACMSVSSSEKDQFWKTSSNFQSLGRRRKSITKCNSGSLVNGSGMNSCWNTCFGFAPCEEYYKSQGLSASFSSLFAENPFSVFGFKQVPLNRRQRRMRAAAHSGKLMAVAVQPAKDATAKKKPLMKNRRVVVTGVGVVSPIGHDPDTFYSNLLEGISGISQIEAFDCSEFPSRIAGEIKKFSTDGWVAPKLSKRADKFMLYMLTAGKKALADGGITEDLLQDLDKARCGVLIGSALGGMKVFHDGIEALQVSYKKLNPFCVPFATSNMGAAMLAIDLGWMGPSYSISTACATSNFCILSAANHIIRGETDMMLCGGSDSAIIPIGLGGFTACGALSQRNSDPTKASRPWDMDRDGFVIGEGSGVLLLEELEHAKKRKAKIYAEFLGGSFTSDAYHMIEPHPEGSGVVLCMEKALAQSGVKREDVNYINAHAASTPAGDLNEYQAILHCFGENPELKINSTKSMTGHLLGAAGSVEAIATVKAIQTGWIHPNINLENPDKGLDMNVLVGSKKERLDIKVALSNSFGFGGHNSSILFAPYNNNV